MDKDKEGEAKVDKTEGEELKKEVLLILYAN